jgi:hypothetical protein
LSFNTLQLGRSLLGLLAIVSLKCLAELISQVTSLLVQIGNLLLTGPLVHSATCVPIASPIKIVFTVVHFHIIEGHFFSRLDILRSQPGGQHQYKARQKCQLCHFHCHVSFFRSHGWGTRWLRTAEGLDLCRIQRDGNPEEKPDRGNPPK